MRVRRRAGLLGVCSGALAVVLSSCAGGGASCPLPVPGTPQATLEFREVHAFGRLYEVFEAKYFLDDCLFYETTDTSLLRRPELTTPGRAVAAGHHRFRLAYKLRGDFQSNMAGWEWYAGQSGELDVPDGGARRVVIQMRDEGDGDPRKRLRISLSFE